MRRKKKAVAAPGAEDLIELAQQARDNPYVQRLIEDPDLRQEVQSAFESARQAFDRINDKGPASAIEDKRVKRDLRDAASSLRTVAGGLGLPGAAPPKKKRRGRKRKFLLIGLVGAGLAVAFSEGIRSKILDALFGAEEEFEYTSTTTPAAAPNGASTTQTVGA